MENLSLQEVFEMTPQTLRKLKFEALKEHMLITLAQAKACVEKLDIDELMTIVDHSPSGDDHGRDNYFLNFGVKENEPMDIVEALMLLNELSIDPDDF